MLKLHVFIAKLWSNSKFNLKESKRLLFVTQIASSHSNFGREIISILIT
jgi:hypothetical protein